MQFRWCLYVFALVLTTACSPVAAQDADVRAEVSDLEFLFAKPFGTRNLGMGWGGVADGRVVANLYYNPSNLISFGRLELSGESQNWADQLDFVNGGGAYRFRIGLSGNKHIHIAPALWYAEQQEVDSDPTMPGSGGDNSSDKYLNVALGLGLRTQRWEFGIGGAIKPAWLDFGSFDDDATAWAFDVGLKIGGRLFDSSGGTLDGSIGASVLNAGSDAKGDSAISELPTETRVGVAFCFKSSLIDTRGQQQVPALALYLNAEVVSRSFQDEITTPTGTDNRPTGSSIGLEAILINVFNLRIGYLDDGINGEVRSTTYGLGLQFASDQFRFSADIAHVPDLTADGSSVTATGLSVAWFY